MAINMYSNIDTGSLIVDLQVNAGCAVRKLLRTKKQAPTSL